MWTELDCVVLELEFPVLVLSAFALLLVFLATTARASIVPSIIAVVTAFCPGDAVASVRMSAGLSCIVINDWYIPSSSRSVDKESNSHTKDHQLAFSIYLGCPNGM